MRAIVYEKYGSTEELQLKEVPKPSPKDNEVLIKVHSVSLNASDVEFLKADPIYVRMWGLFKPKYPILGSDIAGEIVAIGDKIKRFKIGDKVFGDIMYAWGGFAEYVCAKESALVLKPEHRTFQEVAAIPQAGVVALQALRDKGQLKKGQQVLINGAGGGTGTYAIQIAKIFGAEVTGIDNSGKLDLMRKVGADHVIDYTTQDFTKCGRKFDLIIDFVAHRSFSDHKKNLKNNGAYVLVGGALSRIFQVLLVGSFVSLFSSKNIGMLGHEQRTKDIDTLLEWYDQGKIISIIDNKSFSLEETPEAMAFLESGSAKGKVLINLK